MSLNIDLFNISREPGYFKPNNSLILEAEYLEIINKNVNETVLINKESNSNTLWELIKGTVGNEIINYTSKKKKDTNKRESALRDEILILNME